MYQNINSDGLTIIMLGVNNDVHLLHVNSSYLYNGDALEWLDRLEPSANSYIHDFGRQI